MAAYKIYAAEISYLGPVGIVINTAYSNAGGYPRAESFVILPDDTVFCHRLSFDVKSFPNTPIALDDDFMLEQALAQAKVDLSSRRAKHS